MKACLLIFTLLISNICSQEVVQSDANFAIRIANNDGAPSGTLILLSRGDDTKKKLRIELIFTSEHPEADFTLPIYSGQTLYVYKNPASQPDDVLFKIEVDKETPRGAVLRTLLQNFLGENKTFDNFALVGSDASWSSEILPNLAHAGLQIRRASVGYGPEEPLLEATLLEFIEGTRVEELDMSIANIPKISEDFYQAETVQHMFDLELNGVQKNEITDDALAGLNAEVLILGRAPFVTIDGVRRYFQPLFDRQTSQLVLSLKPAFNNIDYKTLFAGLKATELPKDVLQGLRVRRWQLVSPENVKFEFQLFVGGTSGVYEFRCSTAS